MERANFSDNLSEELIDYKRTELREGTVDRAKGISFGRLRKG